MIQKHQRRPPGLDHWLRLGLKPLAAAGADHPRGDGVAREVHRYFPSLERFLSCIKDDSKTRV